MGILQPEKEQTYLLPSSGAVVSHCGSTLLSPGGTLKNPDAQHVLRLTESQSLGVGLVSVFLKTGSSPIHTKLRSTIDYTSLSGLREEETDYELSTLQVPSNHQ